MSIHFSEKFKQLRKDKDLTLLFTAENKAKLKNPRKKTL